MFRIFPSAIVILCFFLCCEIHAQQSQSYIQLSGIITEELTYYPIPYATVSVPAQKRGAYAGADGFFTLVVSPKDTLLFSALGYKPRQYVVPDSGMDKLSSIAVKLSRDTITLDPFIVYPWPSQDEFRQAFLAYKEVQPYTMQPIPGIKSKHEIDTVPKPPSPIMNPISFFYEEVVKPIKWRKPKPGKVDELPDWKSP